MRTCLSCVSAFVALFSGCSSIVGWLDDRGPTPYAGVQLDVRDLKVHKEPKVRILRVVDLPFSTVADTIALPFEALAGLDRYPLNVETKVYLTNRIEWLSSGRENIRWPETVVLAETDALGHSREVMAKGKRLYFHDQLVPGNLETCAWVEVTNNLVELELTIPKGIDFLSREQVVERVARWREEAAKGSPASTNWYWVTHAEWPKWTDSKK
jgi:uncharacterized protein YceK